MLIKHDNLTIRNAMPEDAKLLGKWWRDGKIMAHAGFPLGLTTTDEEIVTSLLKDSDKTCRRLIVEVDNNPIGEMNYRSIGNGTAEIGIKLCDFSKHKKGYGSKFIFMLMDALFGSWGYSKIILDTNLNNKHAQHVYENLGFKRVGERIDCWKNQLGELQSAVDYEMTIDDFKKECLNHWYANIYEQQIIQDYEVAFILETIGNEKKNILEVACGGGRILVPLAKAGHTVVGFDIDKHMLKRCENKIKTYKNAICYHADALNSDWGSGYDVVILGANIILNILSDGDNKEAQKLFIKKAANCLKSGAYLYLDCDCYNDRSISNKDYSWVIFEGYDDMGTYGTYSILGKVGDYDAVNRNDNGKRHTKITTLNGVSTHFEFVFKKHFPILSEIKSWLDEAGFVIEWQYGDYKRGEINEKVKGNRAIIWARKN